MTDDVQKEVDRMLREAALTLGVSGETYDRIMAIGRDSRVLAIPAPNRGKELLRAISQAQQFYMDGQRRAHRITEMPNGYLHNAAAAMRRRGLTGVEPFTLYAMDVEIQRREAEQGDKADG